MAAEVVVQFRAGDRNDIPRLWDLRTRCVREQCITHYPAAVIARWSASAPPEHYAALLEQGGCVVVEDGHGQLLGFGVFEAAGNEIDALCVSPDQAGRGIGHALMQRLLAMADPARKVVLSASLNAVSFYLKHGFIVEREEAYPHPCGISLASVRMRRPR